MYIYIFMLRYMWVYLCVKMIVYMCAHAFGDLMPWAEFASLPRLPPIFFIEVGSFNWTWTLLVSVDLADRLAVGIPWSLPFTCWNGRWVFMPIWHLYVFSGFKTPVLMLVWKRFMYRAISPVLRQCLIIGYCEFSIQCCYKTSNAQCNSQ